AEPAMAVIQGEVGRPGKYALSPGMTAGQLVQLAGGLRRGAEARAELTHFEVRDGQKFSGTQDAVDLSLAMKGDAKADLPLRDGDVLNVKQVPGWQDRGAVIAVRGEVQNPGGFGIRDGERLSSILKRAGGFRPGAYPFGAIL